MLLPTRPLRIGERAPDFHLKGVDGKTYSLESFRDKRVLVVIFSCNHCPVVKAYEDRMIAIQRDYEPQGVQLVAINSNDDKAFPEDSFDNMVKRAREKGFNFPYLRDETQEVARAYGPTVTPEVFVFDEARTLVYHGRIDDSKDPNSVTRHDLRNVLDSLLRGEKPPITETRPFGCSIKWREA